MHEKKVWTTYIQDVIEIIYKTVNPCAVLRASNRWV